MRSTLRISGILVMLASVFTGCWSVAGASGDRAASGGGGPGGPVIRIGWAGPLSGDQAFFGRAWLNGVKMAALDFSFTGPLKGARVEVVALDDGADPARAVADAHTLVSTGVAGVVADFNSGATLASMPVYHRANIPEVTVSSNPAITARGYRNIVQLNENDNFQGGQMAIYAGSKVRITSVAVFHDTLAFGRGVAGSFTAAARQAGITVLGNQTVLDPTAKDYTSVLSPVLARHPQAIYFGGTIVPGELLCRQARAAGFTGPFLGPDGLFHPSFVKGCGPAGGSAYVTTSVPPYNSTPALRSFAVSYRRRFGTAPGAYSVYGYDQTGFLLAAINAAGTTGGPAAVSRLHQIAYHGVLGTERINRSGQLINAPNFVYKVTVKGFIPVYSNQGM
jgi:branched-chain amino acid transport system substrate-binding protein